MCCVPLLPGADQARALFKCICAFAKHTVLKLDLGAPRLCGEHSHIVARAGGFTGLEVQDLKHNRRHSDKHLGANAGAAISSVEASVGENKTLVSIAICGLKLGCQDLPVIPSFHPLDFPLSTVLPAPHSLTAGL